MNNEPIVKFVILYSDFKRLSEKQKQGILDSDNEQVEFLISIKNEVYEKLSDKEKKELEGFNRTEIEPLRVEIVAAEKIFELAPRREIMEINNNFLQSFKEKHKKQSKPYCPKNLVNKNYNTRKKGGR